jgi:hypothetical protein
VNEIQFIVAKNTTPADRGCLSNPRGEPPEHAVIPNAEGAVAEADLFFRGKIVGSECQRLVIPSTLTSSAAPLMLPQVGKGNETLSLLRQTIC